MSNSSRWVRTAYGTTKTPEYAAWSSMRGRCLLTTDARYKNYGGRGISICQQWVDSFETFLADMGKRPSREHSLDRINNDGDYSPENCRWASRKVQARNKRHKFMIEYQGEQRRFCELAEEYGMPYQVVYGRVKQLGWPLARALTEPVNTKSKEKQ